MKDWRTSVYIVITGNTADFPDRCACCGDPAERTYAVSETVTGGGAQTTATWRIPYCNQCYEHVRSLETGVWIFLLFFFTLGFFYIQWRLIWKPRREKRARAMCKAGCSDIYGVRYIFDKERGRHGFEFQSDEYARDFALANRDVLSNPDVLARLGA